MAGRGPAPKQTLSRANDQARREAEQTKLAADGVLRGPELPEWEWHPRTLAWWDTWRRSPQAKTFLPTDWDALAETATLHTRLWNGEVSVAPELRIRVAKWGATVEDRMRLKMAVDADAEAATAEKPAMPADRRRRLMSVVNGAS